MNAIIFLSFDNVLGVHHDQIELFGGSHGIRDRGLLESALSMPSFGFGGEYVHADIFEMAAAYAYHIIKNHPFIDGNKRTGMATSLLFLAWNNTELTLTEDEIVEIGVHIAESKLSKEEVAALFRQKSLFN